MRFEDFLQSSINWLPLVDVLVKVTVLLACAGVLTTVLRRSSAAARHLVWACALIAALALPVLSLALPRWQVPVVTLSQTPPAAKAAAAPLEGTSQQMAIEMRARLGSAAGQAAASDGVPLRNDSVLSRLSWPALLMSVWAIGALLILGRLAIGIAAVHWMSRRTEVVTDAPWVPLAREISARLGLSRVTFRRSTTPSMPMAWGIFRPSIVMPAEADGWPDERLRVVLLHELAHVRRADCLTHILAQAACALYWINPLTWVAARRLRAEREHACDDLVLACGTAGPDYADQLLEIARSMNGGRLSTALAGASLAMARRSQLEGRLMSILDPSVPRTGVSQMRTAVATIVALLVVLPLASVQPWTRASAAVIPQIPVVKQHVAPAQPPQPSDPAASAPRTSESEEDRQHDRPAVTRGVLQGVLQGVITSMSPTLSVALDEALEGALAQNPNPNPNPSPNPNPNPDARGRSQERSKADPKVVAALTEALKDSDKEVRQSAMHALVQLRDPGMFEPLVQALKDASADVRESAAFGLGQLDDKRAVAALSAALKDTSAGVREQAVFALGQLEDPSSVDALSAALRDESASVREQAAFALGQIDDERAVQPLIGALKDTSASVREQAAFALGQLDARAAVDALIAAVKDSDAGVRSQAAFALGQIGDARAVDALTAALEDANTNVRRQAAFALGQLAR